MSVDAAGDLAHAALAGGSTWPRGCDDRDVVDVFERFQAGLVIAPVALAS
jgi:hypothetical protein